jgi:hypothetical protein
VPAGLDARAGMYRSLLAEQPRLVILDNAAEAAQVRPLLPGAGRSMVVVTSRDGLHGLVATDDVDVLRLSLLTGQEASALLDTFWGGGLAGVHCEASG